MSKLDPQSLKVTSFETAPDAQLRPATDITIYTFDPTACTYCFVCPAFTDNCA